MKLWTIPGLMSICVLLTHSSRFVLSTENPKLSNQTSQNQTKTGKAPDRSQSSHSQAKPTHASGTTVTHAQSLTNPPNSSQPNASTPSGTSANSSQTRSSSTPSQPRTSGSSGSSQSSSTPPKLATPTPNGSNKATDQSGSNPPSQARSSGRVGRGSSGISDGNNPPTSSQSKESGSSQPTGNEAKDQLSSVVSGQSQPKSTPNVSTQASSSTSGRQEETVSQSSKPSDISTPSTPGSRPSESTSKSSTPSSPSGGQTGSNPGITSSGGSTPSGQSSTPTAPAITKDKEKNEKLDPSKFTVLTLDSKGSKPKENDESQYELRELSKEFVFQYEFKNDVKCTEFKYNNKQVYKHDMDKHKDQFPTSIFLHLESKRVYLALKDSFFVYTRKDNMWEETEANLVQLDIANKESSSEFELYKKDNIGIYTAKTNVLFKEVIRKKPTCECGSDFTFIQATDPGQYVYKVVRDGTDLTKSVGNVNLYLVNGNIKKFQKTGSCCSKTWSEGGQLIAHTSLQNGSTGSGNDLADQELKDIEVKDHPSEIKLRSKDQPASDSSEADNQPGSDGSESQDSSADNGGSTQSEPPKYAVKKGLDGIFNYDLDKFECTEVKYENEVVWSTGELSNECPKMLHYIKPASTIIFKFTDESFYLFRLIKNGDKYDRECYKLGKFDENSKSKFKIIAADGSKREGNYGLKHYGFGFEICFKKGFKCFNISIDELGNGYVFRFWSYYEDKYKGKYPTAAYCFSSQNAIILFEKFHEFLIDESHKVDPKTAPSAKSSSDGSSGRTGSDGSGTNPSGGSTPSGQSSTTTPSGGSTPSGGGGTNNESGGAKTTNPASTT